MHVDTCCIEKHIDKMVAYNKDEHMCYVTSYDDKVSECPDLQWKMCIINETLCNIESGIFDTSINIHDSLTMQGHETL